jgi:acetyl-CoA acetyltransferase
LVALLLADEGMSVVVNDLGGALDGSGRDIGPAREMAEEIAGRGGRAVAGTAEERSPDNVAPLVAYLASERSGWITGRIVISQLADFTESRAFRLAGQAAFAEAGIDVRDVKHLMIYDAFAHVPIYGLEALGFVGKGEAGAFIADGNTEPGGRLPLNTNGGGPVLHPHGDVRHVRHH